MMINEQLPLLTDQLAPSDLKARPARTGSSVVTYVDSKSILTPGSGFMSAYDSTLNPYSGCSFGCEYCYARFFARDEGLRDTWGEWVQVKQNVLDALGKAVRSKGKHRLTSDSTIYMSSVTDPYQPVEVQTELTRSALEFLADINPRLTIQTRSPIVTRDIDLLKRFDRLRVNMTVTTDDERVRLRYEPHCPAIDVRLGAAQKLRDAGVAIGISISPMLPITDPSEFGSRLAALDAAEYVAQPLKPTRSRFSAGSTVEALAKLKEDQWTAERYREARDEIQRCLGPSHELLEGAAGYRPA